MWGKSKPYWLVLPAVSIIVILFFGGLLEGLAQSLGYFPTAGQFGVSLEAYSRLIHSADFWSSLGVTLRIAVVSTLLSGIVGLGAAVGLASLSHRFSTRSSRILQRVFNFPLLVPHFVGAYLMVLLWMQSGWISRMLYKFGFIQQIHDFPVLINDPWGWGIILTYVWKEAPFIALMVSPALMRIHSEWLEVAQVFGANSWQFFRDILAPLLFSSWFSACLMVFAFTFSAFEVPYLLGVTYPKMLPVLAYTTYSSGGWSNLPEAMAINVLMAIATALLGGVAYWVARRWHKTETGGQP